MYQIRSFVSFANEAGYFQKSVMRKIALHKIVTRNIALQKNVMGQTALNKTVMRNIALHKNLLWNLHSTEPSYVIKKFWLGLPITMDDALILSIR